MEVKDIIKLIEAVSAHGLTSFVLEENGSKISMKKEKEIKVVGVNTGMPAVSVPYGGAAEPGDPAAMNQIIQPLTASGELLTASVQNGTIPVNQGISSDKVITSPLVGTFYNSPSPEAESFVSVGDTVKKGQVLGIIEAMKLMNEIESEYDGVIEAVLVKNEEVVEFGQPLFRIR